MTRLMSVQDLVATQDSARRAQRHRRISYVKSVARLVGYALLLVSLPWAVGVLLASEGLGIAEEIWGS